MHSLGISPTAFARRVRDGVIVAQLVNGVKMYDREEIELARLDTDDGDKQMASIFAVLRDTLKDAQRHAEEAWKIAREPATALSEALRLENESLRKRAADADLVWVQTRQLIDNLQSEHHTRELERKKNENSERRTDEMYELLKDMAPQLVQQVFGVSTVGKFLRTLSPAQLAFLVEDSSSDSFFSPVQKDLLRTALKRFEAEKKEEKPNGSAAPEKTVDSGKPAQESNARNGSG